MTVPHIALLIGSGRRNRFADHPARWLTARLAERRTITTSVIDIRDVELPFYDADTPPAKARRDYRGDAQLERFATAVDAADGFVLLTPEYNHGYPARLKNAIDHVFVEFNRKAIGFVGYGNVGGARAIEQLRSVSIELEMASSRHSVNIMGETMAALRDPHADAEEIFSPYGLRLDAMLDDLTWWAAALAEARRADGTPPAR
jgi:NAD(P)H-dependent FMN reductase